MHTSPNLALAYLQPNQAQKHITLNSALRTLDALVQIGVRSRSHTSPPSVPAEGERFIPAAGAEGAWEGREAQIAAFQDGTWNFFIAQDGWLGFVADEGVLLVMNGGSWQEIVNSALNPAPFVGINTSADASNRLALRSPGSLFDHVGGGHQLKLNKADSADIASCLYQCDTSGRAEIGLIGTDDLTFKVSPDGISFSAALTIKAATGFAGLGTATPASRLHVRQTFDARITIDTVDSGAGGGFDIINSTDGQNWRVTGSASNFKVRDHTAALDKFQLNPGAAGTGFVTNTPRFGIGTTSPTTQLHVNGPVRVGALNKAGLPDAAGTGMGAIILVNDDAGGAVLAFSDGANWRRVTDRAIVS